MIRKIETKAIIKEGLISVMPEVARLYLIVHELINVTNQQTEYINQLLKDSINQQNQIHQLQSKHN